MLQFVLERGQRYFQSNVTSIFTAFVQDFRYVLFVIFHISNMSNFKNPNLKFHKNWVLYEIFIVLLVSFSNDTELCWCFLLHQNDIFYCVRISKNTIIFYVFFSGILRWEKRQKNKMLLRRGSLSLLKSALSLETANGTVKTLKSVRKSCLIPL